jgi:hypothetical protein
MVYQMTETKHLVFSPNMQTSTIICKNATSENINSFGTYHQNSSSQNGHINLIKHAITPTFTGEI